MSRTTTQRRLTRFRSKIRSRHPSHDILRGNIQLLPFRSIVRLGSTTDEPDTVTNGGNRIECNTIESVITTSNKLLMKKAFDSLGVNTAKWWTMGLSNNDIVFYLSSIQREDTDENLETIEFPLVLKSKSGSRGRGNYKIDSAEQFREWMVGKNLSNYIVERFYNYSREYRLHVTEEGCFYTCRKMIKSDTPEDQRWFRNDSNSVWIVEENELFDKPVNWDSVIEHSVLALKAVGLDVGAVDLKIQSRFNNEDRVRENPSFIVLEINSAPSFGEITAQKYLEEIPKILTRKKREFDESRR